MLFSCNLSHLLIVVEAQLIVCCSNGHIAHCSGETADGLLCALLTLCVWNHVLGNNNRYFIDPLVVVGATGKKYITLWYCRNWKFLAQLHYTMYVNVSVWKEEAAVLNVP